MGNLFSPELQQLVQEQLATGKYKSEDEVLLEAMRLFRERDAYLAELRENIRRRLASIDRGEGVSIDDDSLNAFLDEIEAEVSEEPK